MILRSDETTDVNVPGSGAMRIHWFRPAVEGRFPGLVLYSEIYQVTAPIRRLAAMLAGNGYVVAVPEVYHEYEPAGTVLAYDPAGTDRGNDLKFTKPVAAFDADASPRRQVRRGGGHGVANQHQAATVPRGGHQQVGQRPVVDGGFGRQGVRDQGGDQGVGEAPHQPGENL